MMNLHVKMKRLSLFLALFLFIVNGSAQSLHKRLAVESFKEMPAHSSLHDAVHLLVHARAMNLKISSEQQALVRVTKLNEDDYDVYLKQGSQSIIFTLDSLTLLKTPLIAFDTTALYEMTLKLHLQLQETKEPEQLFTVQFRASADTFAIQYGNQPVQVSCSRNAIYKLPEGTYVFSFSSQGFRDVEKRIILKHDTTVAVNMPPGRSTLDALPLPTSPVVLKSEPSDAEILIDGRYVGNTPFEGNCVPGKHTITLLAKDYYPLTEDVMLSGSQPYIVKQKLNPHYGYLSVACGIQNGRVFINDSLVGETPLVQYKLRAHSYALRLEAKGYATYQTIVTISDEETTSLDVCLRPNTAGLSVNTINEPGAELYLNNVKMGKTPYTNLELQPGVYQLKLSRWPYRDFVQTISLTNADTLQKEYFLGTDYAQLTIRADSSDIIINGIHRGRNVFSEKVHAGTILIQIYRDGKHYGVNDKVSLEIGDKKSVSYRPEVILQDLSLRVKPDELSGVQVYVDGEYRGEAPLEMKVGLGEHSVAYKKIGYPDVSSEVTLTEFDKRVVTLKMTSFEETLQFKKSLNTCQWYSIYATGFAVTSAAAFRLAAYIKFNSYENATSVQSARDLHKQVDFCTSAARTALQVAAGCVLTTAIFWLWQKIY